MSEVQSEQVAESEDTTVDGGPFGAPVDLPGPDVDGPADDDGSEYVVDENGEIIEAPEQEDGDEQHRQRAADFEKAMERRYVKLDAENVRHAKRVGELMGDDVGDLIPCPVCMDGIAGWVYPPDVAEPTEEQVSRIRQFAGLPDYSNFAEADWANECPECHGFGKVKTGSRVPGAETTGCLRCNERGWINTRGQQAANGNLTHPEGEIITGPTVLGTEPDPRVASLQAEGWTAIPPMHFGGK